MTLKSRISLIVSGLFLVEKSASADCVCGRPSCDILPSHMTLQQEPGWPGCEVDSDGESDSLGLSDGGTTEGLGDEGWAATISPRIRSSATSIWQLGHRAAEANTMDSGTTQSGIFCRSRRTFSLTMDCNLSGPRFLSDSELRPRRTTAHCLRIACFSTTTIFTTHFDQTAISTTFRANSMFHWTTTRLVLKRRYFDGLLSVDVRVPFHGRVTYDFGNFFLKQESNMGDVYLATKVLLCDWRNSALSGGVGMSFPTGSDMVGYVNLTTFEIQRRSFHLAPFLGYLASPCERVYFTLWGQLDFDCAATGISLSPSSTRRRRPAWFKTPLPPMFQPRSPGISSKTGAIG